MRFDQWNPLFLPGIFTTRVADPDSIGSVDPDPYSESGSRRAKMTHKIRKNLEIHVLKCWISLLGKDEGFFCNLDVLYGGLGIRKL